MSKKVKDVISAKVREVYGEPANAHVNVWKGYDTFTDRCGWHYTPFGLGAICLGNSKKEAIEFLDIVQEYRIYEAQDFIEF